MALLPALTISATGLQAQKIKMDLSSANLANAQTTRGPDGKPYRKTIAIFESAPLDFESTLHKAMDVELSEVKLVELKKDMSPLKRVYDPGHPDADKTGFVSLPNVNMVQEMADMLLATRAYEANVTAFNTTKQLALKMLDIGKG